MADGSVWAWPTGLLFLDRSVEGKWPPRFKARMKLVPPRCYSGKAVQARVQTTNGLNVYHVQRCTSVSCVIAIVRRILHASGEPM